MNKKYKTILYYVVIAILFLLENRIIMLFNDDNKNTLINEILELENKDLKEEVEELSNINYSDYSYVLGKITIKSLYNSDTYFIKTLDNVNNDSPVINNNGLIGIINNSYLIPTSKLNISIKINDIIGNLVNGSIHISDGNYNIGDSIYTSNLSSIKPNLLIGYIKDIKRLNNGIEDIIEVDYIKNNSTYVGILDD